MALTKISGDVLQQPINVGIITATSADFSGIVTASSINATTATFSGNVSIAGTLTYEDVTNIDSIGIITARDTIDAQGNVTVGAGLSVVGVSTLGNTVVGGATTELVVSGNSLVTGISSISDTTQSTTKDTGALVVEGGVGVEKRLNVGGIISSEESAIVMNPNSISRDTTIPSNYNAQTIGPTITVNDGVSVTISSNGEWTITK
jgi:hypothetical protein